MSLLRDRSHGDDVTLYVTYRPSVYLICVCVSAVTLLLNTLPGAALLRLTLCLCHVMTT